MLAFLASARGFQEGEAVPVIASTSTAANLTCIVGGIVVFGDALAAGILLGVQLAAFALVAAAALVTPAGTGDLRSRSWGPAPSGERVPPRALLGRWRSPVACGDGRR